MGRSIDLIDLTAKLTRHLPKDERELNQICGCEDESGAFRFIQEEAGEKMAVKINRLAVKIHNTLRADKANRLEPGIEHCCVKIDIIILAISILHDKSFLD